MARANRSSKDCRRPRADGTGRDPAKIADGCRSGWMNRAFLGDRVILAAGCC